MQVDCIDLQDRKEPTPSQERILGQLAVVGFRSFENKFLALANFPGNRRVQSRLAEGLNASSSEHRHRVRITLAEETFFFASSRWS